MASEIRVDKITSLSGVGTITPSPTGIDIAGITTVATLKATTGIVTTLTATTGIVTTLTTNTLTANSTTKVGSGVTLSPDGDIFATGVTTSTTFVGALTGNVTGNISGGTVAGSTGTFTGDVDIADKIIHTGDTNTAIRFPSADTITAETGGTERFRITSDGKVSVNHSATSGMAPLSVKNTDDSNINVFEVYNDNGNRNGGFSQASDGDGSIFSTTDGGTIKVFFRTDNDSYLTGGNLGLGINNPTAASSETALHIYANEYPEVHLTSSVTGNTASDGSIFTLNNDSSTIIRNQENSYIRFDTNGSNERMRIHSGGTVNIPSGITLGSAISSTDAANTLDDYEEGTFTPTFYYVSGTSGVAYSIQQGRYTKVGRHVSFQMRIQLSSKGSGNNNIRLGGLPFTPSTSGVDYDYFLVTAVIGMNLGSAGLVPFAQMEDYSGGGRITLYSYDYSSSSNYGTIGSSQVQDNVYIGLQGNYVTDA